MNKANKILLVEDDQAIIDVYKTAFEASGIDIEIMTWAKQAIERAKEIQAGKAEKPPLVLLDLLLPDANGMEVLKEFRGNDATKDIKVFVFSNYADKESQEKSVVKPDKFILKTDITPTELVKLVKKELGN